MPTEDRRLGSPQPSTPEACPAHLKKPNLRRAEASEYLEFMHGLTIAPATLAKLASTGGGPAYYPCGRTPMYPRTELDAWAIQRLGKLVRSTSEADAQKNGEAA